jgi:hypothetical protein
MSENNDFGLPQNVKVPNNSNNQKQKNNKTSKGVIVLLIVFASILLIVCAFFVCYKMLPDFQKWTDNQVEKCNIWLNSPDEETIAVPETNVGNETTNCEDAIPEITEGQNYAPDYFVILGSFRSFDNAKAKEKAVFDAGYSESGILEKDGKYYVFANSFLEEADAEIFLSSIKSTVADAWVLKK